MLILEDSVFGAHRWLDHSVAHAEGWAQSVDPSGFSISWFHLGLSNKQASGSCLTLNIKQLSSAEMILSHQGAFGDAWRPYWLSCIGWGGYFSPVGKGQECFSILIPAEHHDSPPQPGIIWLQVSTVPRLIQVENKILNVGGSKKKGKWL